MIGFDMACFEKQLAKSRFALFVALSAALFAAACQGDSATGPAARSAKLRLEAASATQLEGTVGEPLSAVPVVIVRNQSGMPIPGVEVLFAPLNNSGDSVGNFTVVTDSRGAASPGAWILGSGVGPYDLIATLQTAHFSSADCVAGNAICFRAEALPGPSTALQATSRVDSVAWPGDVIGLPDVWATDRFGNPTVRVPITLSVTSGGGSVSVSNRTWTLGTDPGSNSVVASAQGLQSLTLSVRTLDAGAITRYDLSPLPAHAVSGSIALGATGVFRLDITWTNDALPGEDLVRRSGTYTLTGTKIVLTYSDGWTDEGTLVGDALSLAQTYPNSSAAPLNLTFIRRP